MDDWAGRLPAATLAWLFCVAVCCLLIAPVHAWLGPVAAGPPGIGRRRVLARWSRAGLALAGLVMLLQLWTQAATMADVALAQALPAIPALLGDTHYGHAWTLGMAALVACATLVVHQERRSIGGGGWPLLLALCTVLFSRAAAGHAVARGAWGPWVWIDTLHFMAVELWLALVVLAAWVLPERRAASLSPSGNLAVMERVSELATWIFLVVVLTGALNTVRVLADRNAAGAHGLSGLLLLKFAWVAVAAALGGFNRVRTLEQLRILKGTPSEAELSRRVLLPVLRIESGALLVAFAVAVAVASGMDAVP